MRKSRQSKPETRGRGSDNVRPSGANRKNATRNSEPNETKQTGANKKPRKQDSMRQHA